MDVRAVLASLPEAQELNLLDHPGTKDKLDAFPTLLEALEKEGRTPREVMRVYVSQDFDVCKTMELVREDSEWRGAVLPKLQEQKHDVHEKAGKYYWHGKDKQGRMCLVVQVRRFDFENYSTQELMDHFVTVIDRGVKTLTEPDDRAVVIFDVKGESRKQFSLAFNKAVLHLLCTHYPNRLAAFHLVNTGTITRICLKIFLPFLPKVTRDKVHVHNGLGDLASRFDSDQLLVRHGGTSTYDIDNYPQ